MLSHYLQSHAHHVVQAAKYEARSVGFTPTKNLVRCTARFIKVDSENI